jgi:hypothetical protein
MHKCACVKGYRQAVKWCFHRRSREFVATDAERKLHFSRKIERERDNYLSTCNKLVLKR